MRKVSLLRLLCITWSCLVLVVNVNGFTITSTTTTTATRVLQKQQHQQQRATIPRKSTSLLYLLPEFDSSHILETASNILADASSSSSSSDVAAAATDAVSSSMNNMAAPPETGGISYSRASYYTILGLYMISFPGLWSTISRSTKAKMKRKTYISPGQNAAPANDSKGKSLREEAGEIMAYMKANNYDVADAGETITFRGLVPRSLSQAFFLTFCTVLGMLSLALVLQIQFQDFQFPSLGGIVTPNWFWLAFLSPYAGLYYWKSGDRIDDCNVKLSTNDDETENEITVQGSEEELDRMWRALGWREKGMVKVDSVLDMMS